MPAACTCSRTKPFTLRRRTVGGIVARHDACGAHRPGPHMRDGRGEQPEPRWFHALTAQPAERRRTASEPPMSPRPTMPTCCGHSMPSAAIAVRLDGRQPGHLRQCAVGPDLRRAHRIPAHRAGGWPDHARPAEFTDRHRRRDTRPRRLADLAYAACRLDGADWRPSNRNAHCRSSGVRPHNSQ